MGIRGSLPLNYFLIAHTVQDSAYDTFACWRGENKSSALGITGTLILTGAATKWFHSVSFWLVQQQNGFTAFHFDWCSNKMVSVFNQTRSRLQVNFVLCQAGDLARFMQIKTFAGVSLVLILQQNVFWRTVELQQRCTTFLELKLGMKVTFSCELWLDLILMDC